LRGDYSVPADDSQLDYKRPLCARGKWEKLQEGKKEKGRYVGIGKGREKGTLLSGRASEWVFPGASLTHVPAVSGADRQR